MPVKGILIFRMAGFVGFERRSDVPPVGGTARRWLAREARRRDERRSRILQGGHQNQQKQKRA
ncbi:MAG: hypothetical protein A2371_02695 [Candidatus Yanofskybacteria bacterium RIFOXYB1_FULL_44_29]|nr:MAG: hypothetical protein A2371_02695 [Candidatus Yanofskybacteria bacterium RIFOXYB1_FULL_44_29]